VSSLTALHHATASSHCEVGHKRRRITACARRRFHASGERLRLRPDDHALTLAPAAASERPLGFRPSRSDVATRTAEKLSPTLMDTWRHCRGTLNQIPGTSAHGTASV